MEHLYASDRRDPKLFSSTILCTADVKMSNMNRMCTIAITNRIAKYLPDIMQKLASMTGYPHFHLLSIVPFAPSSVSGAVPSVATFSAPILENRSRIQSGILGLHLQFHLVPNPRLRFKLEILLPHIYMTVNVRLVVWHRIREFEGSISIRIGFGEVPLQSMERSVSPDCLQYIYWTSARSPCCISLTC